MSELNVTTQERKQFGVVTLRILSALREGTKTGLELGKLSPTVPSHLRFLRNAGYAIEARQVDGRHQEFVYIFHGGEMPEWIVDVEVKIVDTEPTVKQMRVKAMTARHAKAKARSLAIRSSVVSAQLLSPVTGEELTTYLEGH